MRPRTTSAEGGHAPGPQARVWQQMRERLMGCFREMPGLIGTVDELARLLGATPQMCRALLERLANERAIRRTRDGRYTQWAEH